MFIYACVIQIPITLTHTRSHTLITPLHSIISKYLALRCHIYADDTQIYLSFIPELASSAFTSVETCIKDIFSWMIGNKLSVNPDKTEYLLFN